VRSLVAIAITLASCTIDLDALQFACSTSDDCAHGTVCRPRDSVCVPPADLSRCGDGEVTAPIEGCDDGAARDGDGCSAACAIEAGFSCTDEPSQCRRCGDGVIQPGETCDDANIVAGDGCSETCAIEPGYVCNASGCRGCGNRVREDDEACDDGSARGSGGCLGCRVRFGFECSGALGEESTCTRQRFRAISAGNRHTCGIREDGEVICTGTHLYPGTSSASAVIVPDLPPISAISGGVGHTCVLTSTGGARCWGANRYFDGDTWRDSNQAVVPPGLPELVAISAANIHTCAIDRGGTAHCWGVRDGNRGGGSATPLSSIACGSFTCCGLAVGSALPSCWGNGNVEVRDNIGVTGPMTQLDLGLFHACGVTRTGVNCWGRAGAPRVDDQAGDFVEVGSGHYANCALRTNGSVLCWGSATNIPELQPPPDARFVTISMGGYHACGLRADRTVDCWGDELGW